MLSGVQRSPQRRQRHHRPSDVGPAHGRVVEHRFHRDGEGVGVAALRRRPMGQPGRADRPHAPVHDGGVVVPGRRAVLADAHGQAGRAACHGAGVVVPDDRWEVAAEFGHRVARVGRDAHGFCSFVVRACGPAAR